MRASRPSVSALALLVSGLMIALAAAPPAFAGEARGGKPKTAPKKATKKVPKKAPRKSSAAPSNAEGAAPPSPTKPVAPAPPATPAVEASAWAAPPPAPLRLRAAKSTELAPRPAERDWIARGAMLLLALGLGLWWWMAKRRGAEVAPSRRLRVAQRLGIGVRSELLLVEVDDQTMLLGTSAAGIQRLAWIGSLEEHVLTEAAEVEQPAQAPLPQPAGSGVEPGFASALAALRERLEGAQSAATVSETPRRRLSRDDVAAAPPDDGPAASRALRRLGRGGAERQGDTQARGLARLRQAPRRGGAAT